MQGGRESCGIYNFRFEWSRKAFLTEIAVGTRKYPLTAKLRRTDPDGAHEAAFRRCGQPGEKRGGRGGAGFRRGGRATLGLGGGSLRCFLAIDDLGS